jgi:hypothetical protein
VVDVDPEHLARARWRALAVVVRVAAAAAVAGADVQVAVRPELDPAAVVVGVARVGDRQQDLLGRRIGLVRVWARDVELGDSDVAGRDRCSGRRTARWWRIGMEREIPGGRARRSTTSGQEMSRKVPAFLPPLTMTIWPVCWMTNSLGSPGATETPISMPAWHNTARHGYHLRRD